MEKFLAVFPGQGSQSVGMGRDFYEKSEQARELFELADKALGFSLSRIILDGPIDELTLTQNAQPAILLVSTVAYNHAAMKPAAGAGHSLGEYSALVAAGVISFEDAIVVVNKRGRYMQEAVPAGAGKMIAVMGMEEGPLNEQIAAVKSGVAEIANINSPGQIVAAGDVAGIDELSALLGKAGAKVIPLNVSAPFHCKLMKPAEEKLATDLAAMTFNDPKFPIYANFTGKAVTSGAEARELLIKQVCGTVRWTECVLNAVAEHGVSGSVEFGTGGVLTKLIKRIAPNLERKEVAVA